MNPLVLAGLLLTLPPMEPHHFGSGEGRRGNKIEYLRATYVVDPRDKNVIVNTIAAEIKRLNAKGYEFDHSSPMTLTVEWWEWEEIHDVLMIEWELYRTGVIGP